MYREDLKRYNDIEMNRLSDFELIVNELTEAHIAGFEPGKDVYGSLSINGDGDIEDVRTSDKRMVDIYEAPYILLTGDETVKADLESGDYWREHGALHRMAFILFDEVN